MTDRQQHVDIVARMRRRLATALAGGTDEMGDWRERRDDEGDRVVQRDADDRYLERSDSPATWWAA